MQATLFLVYSTAEYCTPVWCRSLNPNHILYGLLSGPSDIFHVIVRSRHQLVPAAWLDNLARLGICASEWTNHKWKAEYCEILPGSVFLCPEPVLSLLGWACPEQLGLSSTVCRLVLADSISSCTDGVSLLH